MYIKTPKRGILVVIAAVVLSLLLVAGYTAPVLADTEPVLDIGANGTWDDARVDRACIIKDGATYKMWYSGYNGTTYEIGYATSADGINWDRHPGNPVLKVGDIGDWDEDQVLKPWVIKDDDASIHHRYKMYYSGFSSGTWQLGYANSSDGVKWTKSSSNPILAPGVSGWDDTHVYQACILKNETNGFEMWYSGYDGSTIRIGYATSANGEHASWTKKGMVLDVSGGAWDEQWVYLPCVIKGAVDDYKMWYAGSDGGPERIGYATSSDGMTWSKHPSNPVLTESSEGNFDENEVRAPCVIFDSSYKMWYTGKDSSSTNRIGYAISDDGINWTRMSVPEFQFGDFGFLAILALTMAVTVPVAMLLTKKCKVK